MTTGISVIICCHNSVARLAPTLSHLQAQQVIAEIRWEVILVDNASTDDTARTALEIWDQNPVTAFSVVNESTPGLMHARNKGLSIASYSIISFIDDDNWVAPDWISKTFSIFQEHPHVAACGGNSTAVLAATPPSWFHTLSKSYAVGKQAEQTGLLTDSRKSLWGAGLSIRKIALDHLYQSGFKSYLSGRSGKSLTAGEDSELCLALRIIGYQLWYDEGLSLQHEIPVGRLSEKYVLRLYRGFGASEVILALYRHVLNKNYKLHGNWMLELLAQLKRLPLLAIKSMACSAHNCIPQKVKFEYALGYAEQLWKLKGQRKSILTNILKLSQQKPKLKT